MSHEKDLHESSDEVLTALQQKEDTCRRYFLLGFACLPLLWGINAFWFGFFLLSERTKNDIEPQESLVKSIITDRKGQRKFRREIKITKHKCSRILGQIYFYVVCSFVGCAVWSIGILVWANSFQRYRTDWGSTGYWMSFHIPRGN